jgi:small subunit ribosomal protein S9
MAEDDRREDGVSAESGEEPTPAEATPAEATPVEEAPAEETPAEATPVEEAPAEETPAEEIPGASELAAEEPPPEQEPPPEEEQPAEPEAPAEAAGASGGEAPPKPAERKKGEEAKPPPGAELTPITLEPERELSAEERARLEAEAEERARREAAATADSGEEPVARREPQVQLDEGRQIQATGKRKTSIARVVLRPGSGRVEVNRRELDQYFPRQAHRIMARQPLIASGYQDTVDVQVRVHGGGVSGQADAIGHGIAKALCAVDPELRPELKRRGLLTRDARIKERRKAGLKKARKRPQFSKR